MQHGYQLGVLQLDGRKSKSSIQILHAMTLYSDSKNKSSSTDAVLAELGSLNAKHSITVKNQYIQENAHMRT